MSNDIAQIRWKSAITGLIFTGVGGWLIFQIFFQGATLIFEGPIYLVVLLGPTLFIFGAFALLRGLIWGKKAFSGRNVLYAGLFMFIVGIYPQVYLSLLFGSPDFGVVERLGQFFTISLGYPGIPLTIVGFFIRNLNK